MSQPQTQELVARSLRGDERAFRDLIEPHHAMAYAVVRAILGSRHREDVDDVMQLVYVKVYHGLGSFRGDAKFSTWLYQIARREAIDITSRKRIDSVQIEDVNIAASAAVAPDRALGDEDTRREMNRALGQLDPTYRTAIELRYMAEKSYDEIAVIMEVPVGTVKTYVHRGKIELKQILSRPEGRSRVSRR